MKIRKLKHCILAIAILSLVASCVNKEDATRINIEHITPFEEKTLPVKEGYVTCAYVDDTNMIAQGDVTLNFLVPKGKTVKYKYVPEAKNFMNGGTSLYYTMLCFEDTRSGDNDYNDVILWVRTSHNIVGGKLQKIAYEICPIAYGASLPLKFGVITPDGQMHILCDDIRNQIFNKGNAINYHGGYINTDPSKPKIQWTAADTSTYVFNFSNPQSNICSNFFIINPAVGDTIYTSLDNHAGVEKGPVYRQLVNDMGYPNAIAFQYAIRWPLEKTNIATVYPSFNAWLNGYPFASTTFDDTQTFPAVQGVDYPYHWGTFKWSKYSK